MRRTDELQTEIEILKVQVKNIENLIWKLQSQITRLEVQNGKD